MAKPRASSDDLDPADVTAVGEAAKPARVPIIGLGASAGGLEALSAFLAQVPADSGAAYVVVQHLDPEHASLLPELLARSCAMPVAEIRDGTPAAADHVHVIPPDRDLTVRQGVLHVCEPHGQRGHRMPIDVFFAALAEDQQQHAVGVVLSGAGSDGTLGLMAIREVAGLTAAQDPASAGCDAMPRSVIEAGLADVVALAQDLPLQILETLRATRRHRVDLARSDRGEVLLAQVLALLKAQTGHDFSLYKKTTLYRRVERRMGLRRIARLADYVEFLQQHPNEGSLLLKELLIGVTRFFRDPEVWDQLQREIVARLLATRPSGGSLRAWVPGCATGEEAYTLGMVFREAVEAAALPVPCTLQIFATDLNQAAIDHARRGIYPATSAAMMSPERLQRFFTPEVRGGYRVSKDIREMVIFAPHNLLADPPFTKLDLLACRNLMIYLAPEVHETLLQRFHFSLNPDGLLLLGSSESVGTATDLFAPLAGYGQLYQRQNAPLHPGKVGLSLSTTPTAPLAPLTPNADTMAAHVIANLQTTVDQLLLQRYAPAAVLTTSTGDILHISGKTGRYLEPASGKANWNVLAMARDGLSAAMSEAFHDAQRRQAPVTLTAFPLGDDGGPRAVDITVQPLSEPASLKGMALIVFTDVTTPTVTPDVDDRTERQSARLKTMELALQSAREELQTTREEMQTSREELTSTNEELQSTNEELTTSAEELRTMNEELVRARSAAETALARYTDLFDSAPVGYFTIDRSGVISQANLAGSELLGVGRDRPAGGRLALFVVEAERPAFLGCLERAFTTHQPQTCEVGLWREQQHPRRVRISALAGEEANTCRVVLVDVTERVLAEEALRESEDRYRRIVENANEGIWSIDTQARTTFVNSKMAEMLGYSVRDMIGRPLSDFMDTETWTKAQTSLTQRAQGAVETKELRYRRKDGSELWALIVAGPIFGPDGRYQGATALVTDITDRRRMEEELRHAHKMEAVGRLAGGIAHDFNNQLTVIEGYGSLALGHVTDDHLRKCLGHIVTAADRSADLVRQLLTFSRKSIHVFLPVDMHHLIGEVVEVLSRSVNKKIRLEQTLESPAAVIHGDNGSLQNALLNLALNARDAMPDGGVLRFSTSLVDLDQERVARISSDLAAGTYLQIIVSDSGHGMAAEVLQHLFEPFFSTKAQGEGTGLGLASVYGTLTQHGGGIEVDSAIGRGTTFRLYLPRPCPSATLPITGTGTQVAAADNAHGTILVVDDEEDVACLIADTLSGLGYTIHCVHDGAQALAHYREHWLSTDLVVLDMNMPVMAGPETFAALRQVNPLAQVLAMSGYSEGRGIDEVMRGGAAAFLAKPFRPEALVEQVRRILGLAAQ